MHFLKNSLSARAALSNQAAGLCSVLCLPLNGWRDGWLVGVGGGLRWSSHPAYSKHPGFQQEVTVDASELSFNTPNTFHVNNLKSVTPHPPTSQSRAAFPVTGLTRHDRIWFHLLLNTAHKTVNLSHVGHMTQACLMLLISIGRTSLSCHGNARCRLLMVVASRTSHHLSAVIKNV